MIGDTFITLVSGTRIRTGDEKMILEGQEKAWQKMTFLGLFLILIGLFIITRPWLVFRGIIHLAIPLLTIAVGVVAIGKSVNLHQPKLLSGSFLFLGIGITLAGIIAFYMPLEVWITLIMGTLAVWMFASAIILLWRARRGRTAIPERFTSRIVIALASLLLVVFIFLYPIRTLVLLVTIIGWLAVIPGLMLVISGIRLRKKCRHAEFPGFSREWVRNRAYPPLRMLPNPSGMSGRKKRVRGRSGLAVLVLDAPQREAGNDGEDAVDDEVDPEEEAKQDHSPHERVDHDQDGEDD
jgi:uncharacterized membrane protein HdeD (DUF308 family)